VVHQTKLSEKSAKVNLASDYQKAVRHSKTWSFCTDFIVIDDERSGIFANARVVRVPCGLKPARNAAFHMTSAMTQHAQ
jgi:hypothetical protein